MDKKRPSHVCCRRATVYLKLILRLQIAYNLFLNVNTVLFVGIFAYILGFMVIFVTLSKI